MQGFSAEAFSRSAFSPEAFSLGAVTGIESGDIYRRYYVRRGKKLHIFPNAQSADAFIAAHEKADAAIARAQKTSKQARKRLRDKIISVAPVEKTVQFDYLAELVNRYAIPVNLPELIQAQSWERVLQIMAQALRARDEEDIELLLLAS